MHTPHTRRAWLLGLALGVLVALLLSPQTRWIVRSELDACGLTFQSPSAQVRHADAARQRFVAEHPNDLPIQMAAVPGANNAQRVAALRALVPQFPSSPALYANLLRYQIGDSESKTGVYLSRKEDWFSSDSPPRDYKAPPPPAPALLAAFDADAAQGERLDPDNAYFPFLRAVGLFAAHRDAEGLAAVQRAGEKSAWREYVGDETEGRLRLADAAYGHSPALSRVAIWASALYPQYAGLRAVARVAIAQAVQEEQAGRAEQGMAIRRAVMHTGSLMRVQSSVYIGNLVGIAIAAIATARPGGAPMPGSAPGAKMSGEERSRLRLQEFDDYARRIGHPEVAREAQAEAAASLEVRAIGHVGLDRSLFGMAQMTRGIVWWVAGLLSLANAVWLLILGALAAGLSRLPSVRAVLPMPRPARAGVAAALVGTALVLLRGFINGEDWTFWPLFLAGPIVAAIAIVFILRLLRASLEDRVAWRRSGVQFAQAFGVTVLALSVLGGLSSWLGRGLEGYADSLRVLSDDGGATGAAAPQAQEILVTALIGGLILPLLLLVVLSIAGRVRRVPVSVTLVRGFRGAGVTLACLLLIGYGALVLGTLRQERAADDNLQQMVQHEGRYYAKLAGRSWPEAPPGQ